MGKINIGRLILGGIVAGVVADLLDFLVDGLWLQQRWNDAMLALERPSFGTNQIIWFNVLGIIGGIMAIWIYAGIRPRFGAGWKTAVYAGLAVWVIGVLIPNAGFMYVADLFPKHLTLYTTLGGLVEVVAGTVAGAALYKE
jgi:hypothetical protein